MIHVSSLYTEPIHSTSSPALWYAFYRNSTYTVLIRVVRKTAGAVSRRHRTKPAATLFSPAVVPHPSDHGLRRTKTGRTSVLLDNTIIWSCGMGDWIHSSGLYACVLRLAGGRGVVRGGEFFYWCIHFTIPLLEINYIIHTFVSQLRNSHPPHTALRSRLAILQSTSRQMAGICS